MKSQFNFKDRFDWIKKKQIVLDWNVDSLENQVLSNHTTSSLKKNKSITLPTDLVIYDLYDFDGTTFQVSTEAPEPEEAYTVEDIPNSASKRYYFKYPVSGFPVLQGENPENKTNGASPWSYNMSIGVVFVEYVFNNLPEELLNTSSVVSYLYNDSNNVIPKLTSFSNSTTLSVYTKYNTFYRWVSRNEGDYSYTLQYFAIVPQLNGQDIKLKAKLYFKNLRDYYASQSKRLYS